MYKQFSHNNKGQLDEKTVIHTISVMLLHQAGANIIGCNHQLFMKHELPKLRMAG